MQIKTTKNGWKLVTADDVCSLITNGFVGTATTHYTEDESGVLYIQGYNITERGFNFRGIKKVTHEFHIKNKKSCLKKGDLLTIQTGDVGLTSLVPQELEGSNCHALIISRFKEEMAYSPFMLYFYNSPYGRARLKKIETGSTMKHLNVGDLKDLDFLLPSLPEQNRIVAVLETWDRAIETLTKKIEIKKHIKKGLMQELLTGKTRLKGFSGKWESYEFNDFIEVLKKPNGYKSEDYQDTGLFPIVDQSKDKLYSGYTDKDDCVYYFSSEPVIVFGDHSRAIKFINKDVAFGNDGVKLFQAKKNFDTKYSYHLLQNFRIPETGYNRHFKYLDCAIFDLPDIEEQTAIADVLTASDNEIIALEKKLTLFKNQKKYLLNNLITGEIRTPENLTLYS